ncbi:DUF4123 domain-containing protein [Niveibacterium sp. SC-1]|uniref:DUF4123 domain-containing protein n=1 Tax=Niveibacterium sp. SC-1 TaxID=3135646 RepID=UPI00311DD32E
MSCRTNAAALNDALQHVLAEEAAGFCGVLVDRRLRALDDEHPLRAAGIAHAVATPNGRHLDPQLCPELFVLDASRLEPSLALSNCIEEALVELDADSLRSGAGRRIAGFVQAGQSPQTMARHLGRLLVQRRPAPHGSVFTALHVYDPAVLWWLWPSLSDTQRGIVLGPARAWWLLDPVGRWHVLDTSSPHDPGTHALELTLSQWTLVQGIGALNAVLRHLPLESLSAPALAALQQRAFEGLQRAHASGWSVSHDLQTYVRTALTRHPLFDRHPRVQQLLRNRTPDDRLAALIDGVTEEEWLSVAAQLDTNAATV